MNKKKISIILSPIVILGLIGCSTTTNAKTESKFETILSENINGNKVCIIKDKEYNHEYIIVDTGQYDGGIGICERDTK